MDSGLRRNDMVVGAIWRPNHGTPFSPLWEREDPIAY